MGVLEKKRNQKLTYTLLNKATQYKNIVKTKVFSTFFALVYSRDQWENLAQERITLAQGGSV